jgi:hypothetical protein
MQEVMAIAIKAANAFYSGLSPKFLRWSKDAGEDFPRLLFWE